MPITTLEVLVLNKIQQKAIQAILNKLGVNRSFPRRIAFDPKDLCGMALVNLSVNQGIWQIQHCMNHVFAADSIGNLIIIALRSLQLESGCHHHLLEPPTEWLPYITPCWLILIRDFLTRHKMSLKVAAARLVPMTWEHKSYLMDDFCSIGIFNDSQVYHLNLCHTHLQVTNLSDITDSQGTCITNEAYTARKLTD
jgi:hypothetical protein